MKRRRFLTTSAALGVAGCGGGASIAPGVGFIPTPAPSGATPSPVPTGSAPPFPNGTISIGSRGPNSLPNPGLAAGTVDASLPFDHIVVVMMENHSFDNYFGMLPLRGQPLADGFTFNGANVPQNKNPLQGGFQHVFRLPSTCQPNGVSQAWTPTRTQIDGGRMDGFAKTDGEAMGYWDEPDIPFYYSLAKTFCLGNRAFCSATAQTYPNRRYLYSGTSVGEISTDGGTFSLPYPANGTLMDMMSKYGVTWADYFTDLPALAIIPQTVEKYPTNFRPIIEFFTDCVLGTLPNVSFVDPEFGLVDTVGASLFNELSGLPNLPAAIASQIAAIGNEVNAQGGDEENPQDIAIGEAFVSLVVNAVMHSPAWPRTLLIWTYDEHGGYYDHVPPLAAVEPDAIPPSLGANDTPGSFNLTGLRIPTVVVSPYSKPNAVSNVPHDHTSIIATIAAKWNLPALTFRDAQSTTLFDYVNFNAPPPFLTPPSLAAPSNPAALDNNCKGTAPPAVVSPNAKTRH